MDKIFIVGDGRGDEQAELATALAADWRVKAVHGGDGSLWLVHVERDEPADDDD
ncbi:MAG: hypothetical protein ABI548_02800 [Polyangiaceae bacterium]